MKANQKMMEATIKCQPRRDEGRSNGWPRKDGGCNVIWPMQMEFVDTISKQMGDLDAEIYGT
jgi:hypothetical protein